MNPFSILKSNICPLDISNVDTDQIIPKQFLKRIEKSDFGQFLFWDWRYLSDGVENPDFVLNRKEYKNSKILLSRDNFGCGSSREHAPWSLLDYGFQVIISTSFADIFYNNCFQNGILPIILEDKEIDFLFDSSQNIKNSKEEAIIDLQKQILCYMDVIIPFEVPNESKYKLLQGLDDIDITLEHEKEIIQYEKIHLFSF